MVFGRYTFFLLFSVRKNRWVIKSFAFGHAFGEENKERNYYCFHAKKLPHTYSTSSKPQVKDIALCDFTLFSLRYHSFNIRVNTGKQKKSKKMKCLTDWSGTPLPLQSWKKYITIPPHVGPIMREIAVCVVIRTRQKSPLSSCCLSYLLVRGSGVRVAITADISHSSMNLSCSESTSVEEMEQF